MKTGVRDEFSFADANYRRPSGKFVSDTSFP
jgi:hypothetical protein